MSETLVDMRGVEKVFHRGSEDIHVLRSLDLAIPRGEFLALMGPSGSGKSTLLNLIAGLDRPTTGGVAVDGQQIDRLSRRELAHWRASNIGFVFQFYNLLPVLSAERNIELPLLLTSLSKRERMQHVAAALKIVGLEQQQRVAIARAFISDPTLIVADEPTGDLDRKTGDGILDLLQSLNRQQGKTIVMVTHDPHAASHASRRLYLLDGQLSSEMAA